MTTPFDRVVLGDIVTSSEIIRAGYVAIRGQTIAAIGTGAPPPAAITTDHTGKYIFPGLVDGHMHTSSALGWPGIEGATRSAAAGGVTTCVDMPYDSPQATTSAAVLADKITWVNRTAHVDMALYGTIKKSGGVDAIAELAQGGISAFKLSTYEYDANLEGTGFGLERPCHMMGVTALPAHHFSQHMIILNIDRIGGEFGRRVAVADMPGHFQQSSYKQTHRTRAP